jgi:hypothetical protein
MENSGKDPMTVGVGEHDELLDVVDVVRRVVVGHPLLVRVVFDEIAGAVWPANSVDVTVTTNRFRVESPHAAPCARAGTAIRHPRDNR